MPQVSNIGNKYFAHQMRYPSTDFPLMEPGTTQEIEEPYRRGRSMVFRLPLTTRALVLGRWGAPVDEDTALRHAMKARDLDVA